MKKNRVNEEIIIKRQFMAVIAAFLLFFIVTVISMIIFGEPKYGVLGFFIPMFYLGVSSIKNRISIERFRGQKNYSRGTQAIAFGVFILMLDLIFTFIVLVNFPF